MNQQLSTAHLVKAKMEAEEGQEIQQVDPRPKGGKWTTPLTVICCFFVLISFIGAYSAACGFYGLTKTQEVSVERPRTKAERKIKELEETAIAARNKYFPMLVYLEVVKLGLAGAFMFATVLLVARVPLAKNFVIGVCGGALFFHVCSLIIIFLMMSETGTVFNSILDDAFNSSNFGSQADADKAREYATNQFFGYFTVVVAVCFLVRLAFYGSIIAYLLGDDMKKLFGEDPLKNLSMGVEEDDLEALLPT